MSKDFEKRVATAFAEFGEDAYWDTLASARIDSIPAQGVRGTANTASGGVYHQGDGHITDNVMPVDRLMKRLL